jgi:pilus assembly protein TadC
MENKSLFKKRLNVIGWSLLLIWWGLRWSVLISLPEGSGLLGTSIILFGAEAIRRFNGLPRNPNNIFFGLFSLLSGGILFASDILGLPYRAAVLETFMIALGVLLLGYIVFDMRNKAGANKRLR